MILAPEHCSCPLEKFPLTLQDSPLCAGGVCLFMVLLEMFFEGRCAINDPCNRVRSVDEVESEYDFIVVGGGVAGSIVAGRLSEEKNFDVVLLEAGGEAPLPSQAPSFYRAYWNDVRFDWSYRTVPADYCLDQGSLGCNWPRGKALGGSSVLNGMMYHRGHAADYEDWVAAGAEGWSWEENLPYFDMTENNKQIGSLVSWKYHSDRGPLPVQQFRYQPPFLYDLLSAINETGLPVIADLNDPNTPEGFAIAQTFNDEGQRWTTARAYLKPRSQRPNLSVKLHVQVTRVLFEGKRAVGVEYVDENGEKRVVRARKEVILSAGALNSPPILLHSGIGPSKTLEKFNIPLLADLPVGKNLRNHYGMTFSFHLTKLENTRVLDWSVLTEYLLNAEGPMTCSAITQLTGVLYSSMAERSRQQPDLQFFFNGLYAEFSSTGVVGEIAPAPDHINITVNADILQPRSVGWLTLGSPDPLDPPVLNPNFFFHPADMIMIKDAARYIQKIFNSDTLKKGFGIKLDGNYSSACAGTGAEWSGPWLECMARVHTDPQNHQIGTAAMGQVVDPQLRVYGLQGLRVIDASAMPKQLTGNPQGAIMMVAERGAAFIKEAWK